MGVSPENKTIAKHALKAFGGVPVVQKYRHDTEPLDVDILKCHDRPESGITSYSTIGLSDIPMFKGELEFPARLELAGACVSTATSFPNALASAAFCIMRTRALHTPGAVMLDYLREYYPSITVPHLYLTTPFLWEDTLKTLECDSRMVCWLLVVPISDNERKYLDKHGDDAFENMLEARGIDMFDLNRASVI